MIARRRAPQVEPIKFLGAGAFANVFMCRNRKTGELLAMKCILKSLALKKNKHLQVKAEKAALEACRHPNIISLFATFSDEQHVYLLMELALGGELFALIEEMGALDERDARFYAASVTLALEHLHGVGFIFRDMKPENLLLNSGGHLKLCDLGLAKATERAWTLVGTPQYLAPEVLRGEGATRAVDWWGLGILVYEMLCGGACIATLPWRHRSALTPSSRRAQPPRLPPPSHCHAALPFEGEGGDESLLFDAIRRGSYSWPEMLPKIIAPDGGGGHSRGRGEQPPSQEVTDHTCCRPSTVALHAWSASIVVAVRTAHRSSRSWRGSSARNCRLREMRRKPYASVLAPAEPRRCVRRIFLFPLACLRGSPHLLPRVAHRATEHPPSDTASRAGA